MNSIMLHNVPSTWQIHRLGQLFVERKEKVSDEDYPPLSVTKNGIVPQMEHVAKSDDSGNRKRVCIGDFVINSRSDRKGSSGLSYYDGSVSLISIVLKPLQGYPRFLHYLLKSNAFQEEFYRFGNGIVADLWTTRYSELKNIRVAIPSLETQKAISDFLDYQLDNIEQVIAKKQRLLELLEEKTISIASQHTVQLQKETNFRLIPVKRVAERITDGAHISPETEGGRWPFVSTKDLASGYIDLNGCLLTTDESYRYLVHTGCQPKHGDVLFSKDGTIGRIAIVKTHEPFVVASSLVIITPKLNLISPEYMALALGAKNVQEQAVLATRGAALRRISVENVARLVIPVPHIEEQIKLVASVSNDLEKLTEVKIPLLESLERITELRSTLITAAVTGKIDIKTWQKQGTANHQLDNIEADLPALPRDEKQERHA